MKRERTRDESTGTIWALSQVHWQFFVTIALPHVPGVGNRAQPIWNGFRGRLAKEVRILKRRPLLWVVALEWGKSRSNPHLHALISGLPRELQPESLIRAMEAIGRKLGTPDVVARTYDDRLGAVAYLFKEYDQPHPRLSSSDGRWPMISDSVWNVLRRHPDSRSGSFSKGRADA
ncbi:hypothetical protein [Luteolibacter sp. Populi]|uniref:hypothetical protein n=1 Tax=Luteolibacter sp. Populi TaxID=3230487 RepID=UPI003465EC2A